MLRKLSLLLLVVIFVFSFSACVSKGQIRRQIEDKAYSYLTSLFDSVTVREVKNSSDDTYYALCTASNTGKFFDLMAEVQLTYSKNDGTWELVGNPLYEDYTFEFHSNDEFYYYGHRNCSELFQIKQMSEKSVTVINYGHDIQSTGAGYFMTEDVYYNGMETWILTYMDDLQCFQFSYYDVGKNYRIYSNYIEVGEEEANMGVRYIEYNKISPENPDDYWWFEKAVKAGSNKDNNSDNTSSPAATPEATATPQPTDAPTVAPQPTQEPVKTVSGNLIQGSIVDEDDVFCYTYTPKVSGMYRFDFDISNVNANYEVEIVTSKQASCAKAYYSSNDKGISIELNADETYTVMVAYKYLPCDYTITIGVPNPVKAIVEDSVAGSLDYKDKVDRYTYTAPKTGVYRISLDISDTNANFGFEMYTGKNSKVCDVTYSSASYATQYPGVTVTLTAGNTYTMWVSQDHLVCDYTVTICVPNDTVNVKGNSFSGSLSFIEQENTYTYTANKTGTYTFEFKSGNTMANFEFVMKNSKNTTVGKTDYAAASYAQKVPQTTVDLKAGETYTITVCQSHLFCEYTISIVAP